jgi:hypothetical protein
MLGGYLSLKSGRGPVRLHPPISSRTERPIDRGPDLEDRGPFSHSTARFDRWGAAQNHGPSPATAIFLKGVLDLSVFH